MEEIRDSHVRSLELHYHIKLKGFLDEENSWEPVAHLGNSIEYMVEFYQGNPTKPNQATLERVQQEAAKKQARKKARAEATQEANEACNRKAMHKSSHCCR